MIDQISFFYDVFFVRDIKKFFYQLIYYDVLIFYLYAQISMLIHVAVSFLQLT